VGERHTAYSRVNLFRSWAKPGEGFEHIPIIFTKKLDLAKSAPRLSSFNFQKNY
jgi:hypothetical protein